MEEALRELRQEIEDLNKHDPDKDFEDKLHAVKQKALKAGNPMLADFIDALIFRLLSFHPQDVML